MVSRKPSAFAAFALIGIGFMVGVKCTQLKLRAEVEEITKNCLDSVETVRQTALYECYYETAYELGVDLNSIPEDPIFYRDEPINLTSVKYRTAD